VKSRRNIWIDDEVWHRFRDAARRQERSASWLSERVMREFLTCEALDQTQKGKKTRAPNQLEAAVDLAS
jgi:predicted transcriptional regulator